MRISLTWAALAVAAYWILAVPGAHAQSAGDEGTHQEAAVDPSAVEAPEDGAELDFQWLGGFNLSTGNARTFTLNTGLNFSWKEGPHVLDFTSVANLGWAVPTDDDSTLERENVGGIVNEDNRNAQNVIGRLRYDYFLTDDDALFAAVWGRHDPLAGLAFRLQLQAGYLRNLYRAEDVRIWGEVGYDATLDWQDPEDEDETNPVDQHSARLFLGYDNKMNEVLTFRTGFEALFDVQNSNNFRFFSNSVLTSKVNDVLSLALSFTLIYDNEPVTYTAETEAGETRRLERNTLDTITAFSFVLDII